MQILSETLLLNSVQYDLQMNLVNGIETLILEMLDYMNYLSFLESDSQDTCILNSTLFLNKSTQTSRDNSLDYPEFRVYMQNDSLKQHNIYLNKCTSNMHKSKYKKLHLLFGYMNN